MNKSPWKWVLPILLVIVALAVGEQFRHDQLARIFSPTKDAEWIWAKGQEHSHEPISFYAATAFEISFKPAKAELMSLADEESVLFVNGEPVGATRYDDGGPMPVYDVADLVGQGQNRIQVELRSSRGVGAFLLSLEISGQGETIRVVSDASWQIYHDPVSGLFSTDGDLPMGDPPQVWGLPPAGRWSVPGEVRQALTIGQMRAGGRPQPAVRWRGHDKEAPTQWSRLKRLDRLSPALGPWVTFDWGKEVTGYLALRFPPDAPLDKTPLGLIFVGDRPPSAEDERPDAYFVGMAGQRVWLDSQPRRFQFMTFVGLVETSGAEVYTVDPLVSADISDESSESPYQIGAFGLRSTRLRTSLENEVWGEFHGLPGSAGGEQP